MLALLVAGVSGAWAQETQTFNVVYTGRTTTQGAGIENAAGTISYYYGNRSVTISGFNQESITVTGSRATRDAGTYGQYLPNYITPRVVTGYHASVSVSGTTVTIAYAPMTIKYRVLWDKEFVQGGGYTLTGTYPANATLSTENGGDILVITGTNDTPPTRWDDNTPLSTYITPIPVTGYTTGLYFMPNETQLGYEGTIYVNYHTTATETVTTDGIYDYSNIYTRETGSTIKLPDDECAISLHLNSFEEVTKQITYNLYRNRTAETWNLYDVYYLYDYYNGEYVRTNWFYYGNYLYDTNGNSVDFNTLAPVNENGTRLNRTTTTITNEDGQGHDATYTYESVDDAYRYYTSEDDEYLYRPFTYSVTHTIGISTLENAVIPLRESEYDSDGNKTAQRKVTAIQKWGFCYLKDDTYTVNNCQIGDDGKVVDQNGDGKIDGNDAVGHPSLTNNHRNDYLKTVTFEKDANGQSNLESIGDYAFMSCLQLTDIDIPFSVKYMGQGIFEMDRALKNVNFQTGTIERKGVTYSEGVQFTMLRMFTFWCCTAIETLILPDGITDIEGQTAGAALQYMTSLTNISLPNTLERIGPHFLCSASSLETLTIPNSVTYIDGASFHGCENLRTVYILGPAANLQGEFAEAGSDQASSTFSANTTFCAEAVNHCTFYTTDDNYAGYKNDPVWSRIDEDGDDTNGHFGNTLTKIPAEKRVIPTTWVTALFPKGVANYESEFGEGTLVAKMKECTSVSTEVVNGKSVRVYDLTFELLPEGGGIPANMPVLIKAGTAKEYTFYDDADKQQDWWKNASKVDFTSETEEPYGIFAPDGAVIKMKGRYLPHQLAPWDFYFMYKNKTVADDGTVTYPNEPAKFYRVPDQQNAATIKACRCWWTISVDGINMSNTNAKTFQDFFDDETTKVKDVEDSRVVIGGIYDLQGRKLDIEESELPQGLYIVNGKKMVVK